MSPWTFVAAVALVATLAGCTSARYDPRIDPADFSAAVTNPWFPLPRGMTWEYAGGAGDERDEIMVVVTDAQRSVMGVPVTVVRDTVRVGGVVHEDTYDWYAQDREGNVWYFGEDTKSFEDGRTSTEGSWEAGVDGARPGIVMKAHPRVGDAYRQEYDKGEAEDRGEVLALDERVTVTAGTFDRCVRTKDWTDLEPEVVEHKTYCPDVGNVLVVTVQGGSGREELVKVTPPR